MLSNSCLTFLIKKKCAPLGEPATYLRIKLKLRKIQPVIKFDKSLWLKPYVEFNKHKKKKQKKKMMTELEKHYTR